MNFMSPSDIVTNYKHNGDLVQQKFTLRRLVCINFNDHTGQKMPDVIKFLEKIQV